MAMSSRWLAATTFAQYRTEAQRLFWCAQQSGTPILPVRSTTSAATFHALALGANSERGVPAQLSGRPAPKHRYITVRLVYEMGHLKLSLAAGLPRFGRIIAGRRARFLSSTEMALLRRSTTVRPDTTREGRQSKDATSSMWIGSSAQAHAPAKPPRAKLTTS